MAKDNPIIQENFIEYIRLLTYGLEGNINVVSMEEAKKLASNIEIIDFMWKAAVSRPLQVRMLGSFREYYEKLAKAAESEEHLYKPEWWNKLESEG